MPDQHPPRIAVSWARSAPSHSSGFHARLQRLAENALAATAEAGARPVEVDSAAGGTAVGGFDGVLVLGGGDVDPELYGGNVREPTLDNICRSADDAELEMIRSAGAAGIPVLGICRGMQLINVAFGGTLQEDLGAGSVHKLFAAPPEPQGSGMAAHDVVVRPGTLLAEALSGATKADPDGLRMAVQSGHHQAVRQPGAGLSVTATGPDGVIEAVEREDRHAGAWLLGVQWHPEAAGTSPGQFRALLDAFLAAARGRTG